jgi:hypothetical protein
MWAPSEIQILNRYIELDSLPGACGHAVLLRLLFNKFDKTSKPIIKFNLLLSLTLLLLELIHIGESLS